MTAEQIHYAWDRLVRACARHSLGRISPAQIKTLCHGIIDMDPPPEMLVVTTALVAGRMIPSEAAVAGYRASRIEGFDLDAYRKSLSPPPEPSLDAVLSALIS